MFENPISVAFIDDDETLRAANTQSLNLAGFDVHPFGNAVTALQAISQNFPGVIVADIRMPGIDGRQLLKKLREADNDLPVILITGHADIAEAVEAMHEGAYDYLAKPFGADKLINVVRRALEQRRLVLANRQLVDAVQRAEAAAALIGETPVMERLRATISQLAEAGVDVLIEGETGTGKGMVAKLLHRASRRRAQPFVTIAFAAMPEQMIETELFGNEAGAFSGAVRRRTGRIEAAHRGTLFLDEIESMAPAIQGKLLRVLEEREVTPVGGNETRSVDIRVIAAAKGSLAEAVNAGTFRGDLYYRLDVVRLRIPPLRERRNDIPLLFGHFLAAAAARFGQDPPKMTSAVWLHLLDHSWPGNVRELGHFADRVVLGIDAPVTPAEPEAAGNLPQRVDRFEAQLIREALATSAGDVRATLEALRIPRKTFYDKLSRHGIDIGAYRPSK